MILLRIAILFFVSVFGFNDLQGQLIYFTDENGKLHTVDTSDGNCVVTTLGTMQKVTGEVFIPSDITFHPNGKFYGTDGLALYEIDIPTLMVTYIGLHEISIFNWLNSLVCDNNGTMYGSGFGLFTVDIVDGLAISLGELSYQTAGDLAFNNGKLYAACVDNVMMQVNIENPGASTAVGTINSEELFFGIVTFATNCSDIETYGTSGGSLYQLDVNTASATFVCELLSANNTIYGAAMETDYIASDCEFFVDLDYDDSSGAIDFDFTDTICGNATSAIADLDINIVAEGIVDSMLIWISAGQQDGADEQLLLSNVSNMQVFGSGTSALKLVRVGEVSAFDLQDALLNTFYVNNNINYTPGQREISITFYADNGEESNLATAFIYLSEPSPLNIDLGPDTSMCDGEVLVIDASQAFGENYEWQNGSSDPVLEVTGSGTYSVTITDICDATASGSLNVVFSAPSSTIELGPDTTLCDGEYLLLDVTVPEAMGYVWQDGNNAPVVNVTETGSYAVSVSLDCGIITDDILVVYEEIIALSLFEEDTLICDGEPLVLDVSFPNALSYQWQNGETSPTITIDEPGIYNVNVQFHCGELNDLINVNYIDYELTVELGSDITFCYGDAITLNPNSHLATTYLWQDNSTSETFIATEPGIYSVTVSDACQEAIGVVNLKAESCCNIFVPNVFTPDFDGTNDEVKIHSDCDFPVFKFTIFNRWGAMVFESEDQEQGWQGLINGEKASQGVYVWLIEYNDGLQDHRTSGDITLIR